AAVRGWYSTSHAATMTTMAAGTLNAHQAQSKAIDHIEIGVDTLRLLQSLDRRIRLSQPQQDIAAPGEAVGIVRIDRNGALDLRLCLVVSLMKEVDVAENDVRAYFGIIKAQRLDCQFLGTAQEGGWRFRPAHRGGNVIGFGKCRVGSSVVRVKLDGASEQGARLYIVCLRRVLQCRPGAQHIIIGCEIFGWLCELPILFD